MRSAWSPLSLLVIGLVGACAVAQRPEPACGRDSAAYCETRCFAHADGAVSPERRCEAAVGDLCRAHCLADCGDRSAALGRRIAELDSYLESNCGSGRPVSENELPKERGAPARSPLNDLLE